MNSNLSVVIICKNAAPTITKVLLSALKISEDVIVVDSGSTDGTIPLINKTSAKLLPIQWRGYGQAKNAGMEAAANNWIVSLDADECADDKLITALRNFAPAGIHVVGCIRRLNYLGNKAIRHGHWGAERIVRLFNKTNASWDLSAVHEQLVYKKPPVIQQLPGALHHYTSANITAQKHKMHKYAMLMADKYNAMGKKATTGKVLLSPAFTFLQGYVIKRGFLDGVAGWQIALTNAWYTYKKYKLLQQKQQ